MSETSRFPVGADRGNLAPNTQLNKSMTCLQFKSDFCFQGNRVNGRGTFENAVHETARVLLCWNFSQH